jgi:hypothetical protein
MELNPMTDWEHGEMEKQNEPVWNNIKVCMTPRDALSSLGGSLSPMTPDKPNTVSIDPLPVFISKTSFTTHFLSRHSNLKQNLAFVAS